MNSNNFPNKTNIVYKYPLTSCDCVDGLRTSGTELQPNSGLGKNISQLSSQGIPTNMSVRNCEFSNNYERPIFSQSIQPLPKSGFQNLNPQVLTDKFSPNFTLLNCPPSQACSTPQFYNSDPRLISSSHNGQILTLDSVPIESSMKLRDIPKDERLNNYGQKYQSYEDVGAGQIMYYINKSREDPYYEPLFVSSAKVDGYLYQDPMGALKPQYSRTPLRADNPIGQLPRNNYEGCLSSTQDALDHRQDLMARQMRKHNEQRFMPRYTPW